MLNLLVESAKKALKGVFLVIQCLVSKSEPNSRLMEKRRRGAAKKCKYRSPLVFV